MEGKNQMYPTREDVRRSLELRACFVCERFGICPHREYEVEAALLEADSRRVYEQENQRRKTKSKNAGRPQTGKRPPARETKAQPLQKISLERRTLRPI